jgi:elongation factor G
MPSHDSKGRMVPVQLPMNDDAVFGYVDVLRCGAYKYSANGIAESIDMPLPMAGTVSATHEQLLECIADVDDSVLEMVIENKEPPLNVIEDDLRKAVRTGAFVPVLVGSAQNDAGVLCLLDALITLCPSPFCHEYKDQHDKVLEVKEDGPIVAQVIKTYIHPQFGKLSLSRIFTGTIRNDSRLHDNSIEGAPDERIGGLYQLQGKKQDSIPSAGPGEIVAIARMETARTGDTLSNNGINTVLYRPPVPAPFYTLSISPKSRADESKVMGLVSRLLEEDPTISLEWDSASREHRLGGPGEVVLSVALQKLERQYHLQVTTDKPKIAYKEAIQSPVEAHGRHKKQTGGHGQFGEVYFKIQPLQNGTGNQFSESIVGGAIPQQYIPGVEKGVMEALQRGPLAGFPLIDVSVNLFDGSFHDVDSDEMSFRMAAILALREALPRANPQILEPISSVMVVAPSQYISGVLAQITGRRGQILGYSGREDEPGWDEVNAYIPQSELWNYIIDLRSLTHGLGYYRAEFSHMAPVPFSISEELKKSHNQMSKQEAHH